MCAGCSAEQIASITPSDPCDDPQGIIGPPLQKEEPSPGLSDAVGSHSEYAVEPVFQHISFWSQSPFF